MLNQGNRLIISLAFLILVSCEKENEKRGQYFLTHSQKDNFESEFLKSHLNDTISNWIDLDLRSFHILRDGRWKLDEWLYFNSSRDKLIASILVSSTYNRTQDDIYYILGEKYKGQWWFYKGPTMVVIQSNYSDDLGQFALPFSKLSEIARRNALNWYYIEKESDTCLKELFSSGYDSYKRCGEEEYLINDKYFYDEIDIGMNPDPEKRIDWYLNVFRKSKYEE